MGESKKGIYCVRINNIPYVGKDFEIQRKKRIKSHLSELKRNGHWNKEMQEEFNKENDFSGEVLWVESTPVSDDELCELEKEYINKLDSFENGFNKTLGGIGLLGINFTEEQIERKRKNTIGDSNPQSKISLEDFLEIVKLLNEGLNNKEISLKFNLHDRYVSLIRNKRRYKQWFEDYAPDYTIVSGRQFQNHSVLSELQVVEIFKKINIENKDVLKVAKQYGVSENIVKGIAKRKTFKEVTKSL